MVQDAVSKYMSHNGALSSTRKTKNFENKILTNYKYSSLVDDFQYHLPTVFLRSEGSSGIITHFK